MKDRADAVDSMQASTSVAAALTVAIQTPRLQIIVVPESDYSIPTRRQHSFSGTSGCV
jgi:hypothetical protein